uniref:GRAS24 protein n=1 Tax=Rhizophora mucronata TaxID=61149 RepID=A0A2P2LR35_RHIMU
MDMVIPRQVKVTSWKETGDAMTLQMMIHHLETSAPTAHHKISKNDFRIYK